MAFTSFFSFLLYLVDNLRTMYPFDRDQFYAPLVMNALPGEAPHQVGGILSFSRC